MGEINMLFYGIIFAAETQTYLAVKEWLLREELRDEGFACLSSCKAHIIKTFHKRSLMNRMLMCTGKDTYSISQQIHNTFSQLNIRLLPHTVNCTFFFC